MSSKITFMPTILEYAASVINQTPSAAAINEELLSRAHIKASKVFQGDLITVGIDVYNIEAEALGSDVRFFDDNSIPGIISRPPIAIDDELEFSTERGRIKLILSAAEAVKKEISGVPVGIGICAPFSILVERLGYEEALFLMLSDEDAAHRLLQKLLSFQKKYCEEIAKRGLGVTIFESWATPPLISPQMYREFAFPHEKELISAVKSYGIAAAPLVIGGDTSLIADDILLTGSTLLVADYCADIALYLKKASDAGVTLRVNIDPKMVQSAAADELIEKAKKVITQVGGYEKFVLGTGVIPYDTPPENLIALREFCNGTKL